MRGPVFTIGHSNHAFEPFAALLNLHSINLVADVRSSHFSQFNPQFNREQVQARLRKSNIGYEFLGRELGARPDDPLCYLDGRVQYNRLAQTQSFRRGIAWVCQMMDSQRLVLMCAEKEPLACHRTILIARELDAQGVQVIHVLADGSLETHQDTIERLLADLGRSNAELFRTREEIVAEAYAFKGEELAYSSESPPHKALS